VFNWVVTTHLTSDATSSHITHQGWGCHRDMHRDRGRAEGVNG